MHKALVPQDQNKSVTQNNMVKPLNLAPLKDYHSEPRKAGESPKKYNKMAPADTSMQKSARDSKIERGAEFYQSML
jgi:hypothetical protein